MLMILSAIANNHIGNLRETEDYPDWMECLALPVSQVLRETRERASKEREAFQGVMVSEAGKETRVPEEAREMLDSVRKRVPLRRVPKVS
jgi:hypothetical protein